MPHSQFISTQQLQQLRAAHKAVIIDVREADEYAYERIPQSKNVPLSSFSLEKIGQIPEDKTVVFHCRSGTRTHQAKAIFDSLAIKHVAILEKGLIEWKQSGGETISSITAPFPIMRQVQIIVGFMVVLGCVLGYFVSPYFIGLSAFFGAGLLFAGLSGTCGMARILEYLPFNRPKT